MHKPHVQSCRPINLLTRQDAFERIQQARTGFLAGIPTEEYLIALRQFLFDWADQIENYYYKQAWPHSTVPGAENPVY
jgi:hypothetical protein